MTEDKPEKEESVRLLISLTPREFRVLKRLAEIEGRPVATYLMEGLRQAKLFTRFEKMLNLYEKALKLKEKAKSMFHDSEKDIHEI
ncbi:hypothetical protein YE76_004882 [Salmonella enterica subsp. enterica]|nr:hypothetical protein [Salmonella enterica subsp. enterica serovar Mikawasima]EDW3008162.1 hypothetical protein [Salmonella enterica subsp. enterica serovar Mikawasima]EEH5602532.1 hypothetical protein [Salmonella enterica subsp. enterica serovar Richmond]